MRFFHGKFYDDNKLALVSACLYNLKWLGVFLIVINILPVVEKGALRGLDDETAFWGTFLVITTVSLFVFKQKWQKLCDKFTDYWAKT